MDKDLPPVPDSRAPIGNWHSDDPLKASNAAANSNSDTLRVSAPEWDRATIDSRVIEEFTFSLEEGDYQFFEMNVRDRLGPMCALY
jgi:hypothetical protein